MKNLFALFVLCLVGLSAHAAHYKCYASKYPTDIEHAFTEGYVTLAVTGQNVQLKFFRVNPLAKTTTLDFQANYKAKEIRGGNSQVKGMYEARMTSQKVGSGDGIDTIFFDTALIDGETKKGLVGKFAFSGHGYSWDWNLCYNAQ